MKKITIFILFVILSLSLVGCAKLDFGKPDKLDPKENNGDIPTSVVLESVSKVHKLYVGSQLELKATVYPATVTKEVLFSSNDEEVATVNQQGVVTGVSPGTVKITAKVEKSTTLDNTTYVEGHLLLTVMQEIVELEDVLISGPDSIYIDDTAKFSVIKTPENATFSGTWSTNDENIATIDQNGIMVAKAVGSVKVSYFVDENINDTFVVNVLSRSNNPTGIEIIVRDIIEAGQDVQAFIKVLPEGSLNNGVNWSIDDEEIATVNEEGLILGLSEGTTTLRAELLGNSASVEIEVKDYRLDSSVLEDNLVDLVRTRKDSVLGVSNYKYDNEGDLLRNSLGSGFVYKVEFVLKNGAVLHNIEELRTFADVDYYKYYLITNRHVVIGSDKLKIYLHKIDNEIDANLIQYDDKVDLAIVSFTYDEYIRPLELANSDELVSGKFAAAIGNPSGYEFSSSLTFGIISHPKRFLPTDTNDDGINDWDSEYIQHDVAINPGNSGGPLFNLKGEVIGINTLKYASTNIEGMGFSIPINIAKDLIPILEDGEKPNRALLGVTAIAVKDVLNNPKSEYTIPEGILYGLYVTDVVEGSAAFNGGILKDDIIISFNNVEITNVTMLRAELNQIVVGNNTEIDVVVFRNNEYITLKLVF
ncbi:MAG: Ig-like domain-containing protein [Bacilli bacterium]|nr:Ig-like domain-containing protein [Bacilli bacterium]